MTSNDDGQPTWQSSQSTSASASSQHGTLMSVNQANQNTGGPMDLMSSLKLPIGQPTQKPVFTGSLKEFAGPSTMDSSPPTQPSSIPKKTQAPASSLNWTGQLSQERLASMSASPGQQQQLTTGLSSTALGKRRQEQTPTAVSYQASSQAQLQPAAPFYPPQRQQLQQQIQQQQQFQQQQLLRQQQELQQQRQLQQLWLATTDPRYAVREVPLIPRHALSYDGEQEDENEEMEIENDQIIPENIEVVYVREMLSNLAMADTTEPAAPVFGSQILWAQQVSSASSNSQTYSINWLQTMTPEQSNLTFNGTLAQAEASPVHDFTDSPMGGFEPLGSFGSQVQPYQHISLTKSFIANKPHFNEQISSAAVTSSAANGPVNVFGNALCPPQVEQMNGSTAADFNTSASL